MLAHVYLLLVSAERLQRAYSAPTALYTSTIMRRETSIGAAPWEPELERELPLYNTDARTIGSPLPRSKNVIAMPSECI